MLMVTFLRVAACWPGATRKYWQTMVSTDCLTFGNGLLVLLSLINMVILKDAENGVFPIEVVTSVSSLIY